MQLKEVQILNKFQVLGNDLFHHLSENKVFLLKWFNYLFKICVTVKNVNDSKQILKFIQIKLF